MGAITPPSHLGHQVAWCHSWQMQKEATKTCWWVCMGGGEIMLSSRVLCWYWTDATIDKQCAWQGCCMFPGAGLRAHVAALPSGHGVQHPLPSSWPVFPVEGCIHILWTPLKLLLLSPVTSFDPGKSQVLHCDLSVMWYCSFAAATSPVFGCVGPLARTGEATLFWATGSREKSLPMKQGHLHTNVFGSHPMHELATVAHKG